MAEAVTNYIELETLKNSLRIDDEEGDKELIDIIYEANADMDSRLKPFVGDAPLDTESDIFFQAKRLAIRHARSIYYEAMGLYERSKNAEESYDKNMKNLIKAVKAERTDRTKLVFISGGDKLDKIHQPANIDEYILDEFS